LLHVLPVWFLFGFFYYKRFPEKKQGVTTWLCANPFLRELLISGVPCLRCFIPPSLHKIVILSPNPIANSNRTQSIILQDAGVFFPFQRNSNFENLFSIFA